MPRLLEFTSTDGSGKVRKLPVATEEELLDFANKVRQAGGAAVLEALLPSLQSDSQQCLIANALNFGCEVDVPDIDNDIRYRDGSLKWVMHFPETMSEYDRRRIIDAVPGRAIRCWDNSPFYDKSTVLALLLPKHIGNAAAAFDHGIAFQNFVVQNFADTEDCNAQDD